MKKYRLNDLFTSFSGETNSFGQGLITQFVRFSGCNLDCSFCDTDHNTNFTMTEEELLEYIVKQPCKNVLFTGGEPLLQMTKELFLSLLRTPEMNTVVETNGTVFPVWLPELERGDVAFVVDYKVNMYRSYANGNPFLMKEWCSILNMDDTVKFLISSEKDFFYAIEVMKTMYSLVEYWQRFCSFAFSPIIGEITPNHLLNLVLTNYSKITEVADIHTSKLKIYLNLQAHKFIGAK